MLSWITSRRVDKVTCDSKEIKISLSTKSQGEVYSSLTGGNRVRMDLCLPDLRSSSMMLAMKCLRLVGTVAPSAAPACIERRLVHGAHACAQFLEARAIHLQTCILKDRCRDGEHFEAGAQRGRNPRTPSRFGTTPVKNAEETNPSLHKAKISTAIVRESDQDWGNRGGGRMHPPAPHGRMST